VTTPELALIGCLLALLGALRAAWSPCGLSMLSSLTPVGERSRGMSWPVTAGAYAVGAIGAATVTGAVLGAVGTLLPGGHGWRGLALLVTVVVALLIDASPLRRRLPLARGQVNEDWMARYRGWVYGLGYGARLGVGFTTLVACAAVYATFLSELLVGSTAAGALIGFVFGAVKALSLLPAGRGRDHASLAALHRTLARLDSPVARTVVAGELLACAVAAGVLR
jgi:hypothetical protein